MPNSVIPAGPFQLLKTVEGESFPYYIIPFDKEGVCVGPKTRDHLIGAANGFSDIFVFCHGWNNDWTVATDRYRSFIEGYQSQRKKLGLTVAHGYTPVLVGVFWPSQALAWLESEKGPQFAGHTPQAAVSAGNAAEKLISEIASEIPSDKKDRFYVLAQSSGLSDDEATEFVELLAGTTSPDTEGLTESRPSGADLLAAAESYSKIAPDAEPDYDDIGTTVMPANGELGAAGGSVLGKLDPRNILKPFTVWQMKDRAGVVGSRGVSALLCQLLDTAEGRVHLLGHSYGCKVVMNALSAIPDDKISRKVHSVTLLQAAFSQYAFADSLPDRPDKKGGFHKSLGRVKGPILATYSANDVPLTREFHLALRRKSDLGELDLAAAGGTVSRFGALGGFGPQPSNFPTVEIKEPGAPYEFGAAGRVLGIEGTKQISGHGDISNPATWWLSYCAATALYQ